MPNYTLTSSAHFTPMTYDEIAKPGEYITNLYKEAEDKYALLNSSAAEYENLANEQTDPLAAAMYKRYAAQLALAANDLAKNGYTAGTTRAINDLTAEYNKSITPIKSAFEKKQQQIAERQKLIEADDSYIASDDPNNLSLDDLILNPSLNANKQVLSGRKIAKDASDMASNLAKEIETNANVREVLRQILPYQYRMLEEGKFSSEDVLAAIVSSPNASPILDKIIEQAIESSGALDWQYKSKEDKKRVINQVVNRAQEGIWSAVGTSKYHYLKDDFNMQDELAKRAAKRTTKKDDDDEVVGPRLNPETLYGKNERDLLNKHSNYFKEKLQPDGTTKHELTEEGIQDLKGSVISQYDNSYMDSIYLFPTSPSKSDFYTRMESAAKNLGYTEEKFKVLVKIATGNEATTEEKNTYPEIAGLPQDTAKENLERIYEAVLNPNDLASRTRYRVDVDPESSEAKSIKTRINYALARNSVKLQEVDFDPASGEYKLSGGEIESLGEDDKIIGTSYSKYGSIVIVWPGGDSTKQVEYRIPKGINQDAENERDANLRVAHEIYFGKSDTPEDIANSISGLERDLAKLSMLPLDQITPEIEETVQQMLLRYRVLNKKYKAAMEKAELAHSQVFYTNKTKPQEFDVYQQRP